MMLEGNLFIGHLVAAGGGDQNAITLARSLAESKGETGSMEEEGKALATKQPA